MKDFKSSNGYYKYYNKEGKACRIKIEDKLKNKKNFNCFIWFKYPKKDYWMIHEPNKKFKDVFQVINYLCKNLETNNIVFKVTFKN